MRIAERQQPRLRRVDLNEQVYATVRNWIVTRQVKPGEKLSLHALAAQLGVSRSPVHHALTRLAAEGVVTARPRRGYFVSPLTPSAIEHAYDVRLGLELVAAERSVGRVSAEQLAELRGRVEATLPRRPGASTETIDAEAWHVANHALHEYQVSLAGNPLLLELWRRSAVMLLMQRVLGRRGGPWLVEVTREHLELVEAFEAEDLARVQTAIRRHVETGRRVAAEALEESGEGA